MFKLLKRLMNNEKLISTNDVNSMHRILKSDIKKDPIAQEDEIIFGCGCFWGAEKCFWKLPGVVTTPGSFQKHFSAPQKQPHPNMISPSWGLGSLLISVFNILCIELTSLVKLGSSIFIMFFRNSNIT